MTVGDSETVATIVEGVRSARLPGTASSRKRLRQRAGLSLREVASVVGVHPMTVLRWEEGVQPRRDHAIAYRQLLDALEEAVAS